METLTEAQARLRGQGYALEFLAERGGRLRCADCDEVFDAAAMAIDEIVRFEGTSDPGDEAILFALRGPCGHTGLYSAAYGPAATPEDADVAAALRR
jgi:hypothetical protein